MEVFVVRLWTPSEEASATETVRGTALHVPSGTTVVFSDPETLLDFLASKASLARAIAPVRHGIAPSPEPTDP